MPSLRVALRPLYRVSTWIALVACVAVLKGHSNPVEQVGRLLGSVADVSVASAAVATLLLNRTNSFAATASSAVQSISVSSLDLFGAAWRGVDLVDLTGRHLSGRLVVDDASVFKVWLQGANSHLVTGCNNTHVLNNGQLLQTASPSQCPTQRCMII